MIACTTCTGAGIVLGNWNMEPCTACGGTGEFTPHRPDPVDGPQACFAVAAIGGGLILGGVLFWEFLGFLWSVLPVLCGAAGAPVGLSNHAGQVCGRGGNFVCYGPFDHRQLLSVDDCVVRFRGEEFGTQSETLEPILPEGQQPCEAEFKRDLDLLLEREGVSA